MASTASVGHNRRNGRSRVSAITFDFGTSLLEQLHPDESWGNAYGGVGRFFEGSGFEKKQGSVGFALDNINAVECVAPVQDLGEVYDWFTPSLKDIRTLRVEVSNDLMPILDREKRRKAS